MAQSRTRVIFQYVAMIILTTGLLWLSLRALDVGGENKGQFIWDTWTKSNKGYLLLMAALSMVSHVIRAERWKMLLVPSGNSVPLSSSFLSLMIGYLVNLAIPRGGEVSRCYNLYKLEKTPVEISFGTVVVERIVDVICLVSLIVVCFFVEWEKLKAFIDTLPLGSGSGFKIPMWAIVVFALILAGVVAGVLLRKNEKLKKILIGFREG